MPTSPTDTPPNLSPAMQTVRDLGRKLARTNTTRDRLIAELRDAIRAADAEGGNSRTGIVEASGIARATVYEILKDQPAPPAAPPAPVPADPAVAVACDTCDAAPGSSCTDRAGRDRIPHSGRVRAALAAAAVGNRQRGDSGPIGGGQDLSALAVQ